MTNAIRFIVRAAGAAVLVVGSVAASAASTPVTGASNVSVGDLHACAIVNGGVKCWGLNDNGQLGNGSFEHTSIAVDVVGLPAGSNVTDIAAGYGHTCAVRNGTVLCWGRGAEGQLGTGALNVMSESAPVATIGLPPGVTAIAAGNWFTCAIASGAVYCWGTNYWDVSAWPPSATPQQIVASGAAAVATGSSHACAVVNGGVQCWGVGIWGQLGDGSSTTSALPMTAIPSGAGATDVGAGYSHSCAVVGGGVKCWGTDYAGELGTGSVGFSSPQPVDVVGLPGTVSRIAVGGIFTCAAAIGGATCWGSSMWGSLGNGTAGLDVHSPVPVDVTGMGAGSGVVDVSGGLYSACTVANGQVLCWGFGGLQFETWGTLGNGGTENSAVPVLVVTDNPVINSAPALAPITIAPDSLVAVGSSVSATAEFSDPDVGDTHSCTISWGDGSSAQLALATTPCSGTHAYAAAGVYVVTMAVTDAAGASDSRTYAYVVVFDPSAGFVTGGGWFASLPGAYLLDPSLGGGAHIGFVARYQKGAHVPDGNTVFQFTTAGLTFRSTSYDWLVVAGRKAIYKGAGTLNGADDYGFQLTAVDAAPGEQDRLRLRIWNRSTGAVVYDNQTCGPLTDDADPCTVLQGGEIVVHAKK